MPRSFCRRTSLGIVRDTSKGGIIQRCAGTDTITNNWLRYVADIKRPALSILHRWMVLRYSVRVDRATSAQSVVGAGCSLIGGLLHAKLLEYLMVMAVLRMGVRVLALGLGRRGHD